MAKKLNKGEKQKIVEGLNELYNGNTSNEFVSSLLTTIDAYKSATPTTDAEKAKVAAAKKGATVLVEVLTQFLKKKSELLNQKFLEYKSKVEDTVKFIEGKDFIKDSANFASLRTRVVELITLGDAYREEFAHLQEVVALCDVKGLVKDPSTEIPLSAGKMSNEEAIAHFEIIVNTTLDNSDELDKLTSISDEEKSIYETKLRVVFEDLTGELRLTVADEEKFKFDAKEILDKAIAKRTTPTPTTPDPIDPDPTKPTKPDSTDLDPTKPDSIDPGPTKPDSADLDPTKPDSIDPGPTKPTKPDPIDPDPTKPDSYIPSDEFKTKYTALVTIINQKIMELIAQEKEVENNHSLIAASSEISYELLEEFTPKSNMAHNIEMAILEARKNITMLEHEEYRKNPVYYAKFDSSLLGVSFDYDKLKEVYDGSIQVYYDDHAKEISYALGEIEKQKASATPDVDRIRILQEFIISEKNTINRHLMGYASIHKDFDLKSFLETNKNKFKAIDKSAPTLDPTKPDSADLDPTKPDSIDSDPTKPDPGKDEIKAHLTILYKEIAKAFIEKYTSESPGISFEQYFQVEFIKFVAEFKKKASSGKFDNLDVNEEGHLVWKEKGIEIEVDFRDFARVLIEERREIIKSKIQADFDSKGKAKATLRFNTKNKEPEHVDTAKAIVVNAVISNEMFEITPEGKRQIKRAFIDKVVDSGLQLSAGGKNLTSAETEAFIFETSKVEGEQTVVIDVKDPSGKLLCQIQVQLNPEVVRKMGM